ncbi:MAG: hypothetical protein R3B49_00600 [Phycisphaerales bacterium]
MLALPSGETSIRFRLPLVMSEGELDELLALLAGGGRRGDRGGPPRAERGSAPGSARARRRSAGVSEARGYCRRGSGAVASSG